MIVTNNIIKPRRLMITKNDLNRILTIIEKNNLRLKCPEMDILIKSDNDNNPEIIEEIEVQC